MVGVCVCGEVRSAGNASRDRVSLSQNERARTYSAWKQTRQRTAYPFELVINEKTARSHLVTLLLVES